MKREQNAFDPPRVRRERNVLLLFGILSVIPALSFVIVPVRPPCRLQKPQQQYLTSFSQPLYSARNVNDNGEPISDLQSTSIFMDGDVVMGRARYHHNSNDTYVNGGEEDVVHRPPTAITTTTTTKKNVLDASSVIMSSVTHWSDIMRHGSWWCENGTSKTALLQLDAVLSDTDLNEIEVYWDRIMPTVSYLGTVQVAKIYKALCVAYRAHRGQMRKSGEPFIVHVRTITRACLRFIARLTRRVSTSLL